MFEELELKISNSKLRIALMEHAQVLARCAERFGKPEYLEQAQEAAELANKFK